LRIGLLYPSPDPLSPSNWSGTPNGLATGMRAQGIEVVPIPCHLPLSRRVAVGIRRRLPALGYMTMHRQPGFTRARSLAISEAIASAGRLDGILAMGTDLYDLDLAIHGLSIPVATYDDGTFALFLRYPDSDISALGLPNREVRNWVDLQRRACNAATLACVSTQWAKASIVSDFGLPESRVRVVGMGHRPKHPPTAPRDYSVPRFLFVGVEWRRKNGAVVLEAFSRIRRQIPDATLAVVGDHPPIDLPGVTGYGFLPRDVPEAQQLLDRLFIESTAFVLPSLFDPSPIAYLEAASAGLPVIATTCGGAGELLGAAALSVEPHDLDALTAAMLRLADGATASRMGQAALQKSADSTWQQVSSRIISGLFETAPARRYA